MTRGRLLQSVKSVQRTLAYRGSGRFCPVCGRSSRRFGPYGVSVRENARCVYCGSLERHRLSWIFLEQRTDLFDGVPKTMLHVAPERCLEARVRQRLRGGYVTADLLSPDAMVTMDITDIPCADESVDVIHCSHVLEHVEDDRRAMRELYRVLKPGGWAIVLVPVYDGPTLEDPSVVTPEERLRVFGQSDHVRRYGHDYVDRLRAAGFTVETTGIDDLVDADRAVELGLTSAAGQIFSCTKPGAG